MKLIIEIEPAFPADTAEELWEVMLEDRELDPRHQLTLETRSFAADVKSVARAAGAQPR